MERLGGGGPRLVVITTFSVGFLLLVVSHLAGARRDLLLVRSDLATARQALLHHDDGGATAALNRAYGRLKSARRSISGFPIRLLDPVPLLGSPGRGLTSAVRAGLDGVAAGRILVSASSSFPTSAGSGAEEGQDLSALHAAAARSEAGIREANEKLAAAAASLAGPAGAFLPPVSGPARAMRAEIESSRASLSGAGRGLTLLVGLTAQDTDLRLLVLAQDTLELRPTGGFIGSYGVLHFGHGTAKLEKYEATEDLPPATPPLPAPPTLATYLLQPWGLSNANWSPDFPTSARSATELFRRQGGGEVDGVLALTELATARLVGALGSLQLPNYQQPVVQDGFDSRIVYEVELKRPQDVPRKKFVIELANVLFDRLFHLPSDKLPEVADAVRDSIGAGDIQLWFKDPARQRMVDGTEVAGALPQPDGDFLMMVDANMTASKANLDVIKLADYHVETDDSGHLVGHLRVEVRNNGAASPVNPFYNGYLRIYVPGGARLINEGYDTTQLAPDGPFEVFSRLLFVQPKQQVTVAFDYRLPPSVDSKSRYRLTWLRQAGTPQDQLRLAVNGRTAEVRPGARVLRFQFTS